MYEVVLTSEEMTLMRAVVGKFRDDYDSYPGSQMTLTNKTTFTAAANLFLAATEDLPIAHSTEPLPLPHTMGYADIHVKMTVNGRFLVRTGTRFGVLASTAVGYEVSLVEDFETQESLRSIANKFCNQPDIIAATEELFARDMNDIDPPIPDVKSVSIPPQKRRVLEQPRLTEKEARNLRESSQATINATRYSIRKRKAE